jgi:hypothetical protein
MASQQREHVLQGLEVNTEIDDVDAMLGEAVNHLRHEVLPAAADRARS